MRQSLGLALKKRQELFVAKQNNEKQAEIVGKIGYKAYHFINGHVSLLNPETVSFPNYINTKMLSVLRSPCKSIVALERLNTTTQLDFFIKSVNNRLEQGGIFIGCCETSLQKQKLLEDRYISPIRKLLFAKYFICKRLLPKIPVLSKVCKFLGICSNKSIGMSRIEMLGRLYYGGFQLVAEKEIGYLNYFVVKKTKEPSTDPNPSYFPLIKLKRVGKYGKRIKVYKFRTMHPYSEYLQQYMYEMNSLDKGGKIKDDIRVSKLGRIMRRLWIDELPMLINLLRGDLKLFGVRPISEHYYSLYTEELKELRQKHKPGFVPPYYADLPKTLDEIIESEKKYLLRYEKAPFITDFRYFFVALFNILIRGNLSK